MGQSPPPTHRVTNCPTMVGTYSFKTETIPGKSGFAAHPTLELSAIHFLASLVAEGGHLTQILQSGADTHLIPRLLIGGEGRVTVANTSSFQWH
jgi:hypothetical protein